MFLFTREIFPQYNSSQIDANSPVLFVVDASILFYLEKNQSDNNLFHLWSL